MTEKKIPAIRFKGFTDDWEQRKLGEVANIFIGGGTPSTKKRDYWEGTIQWIQSSDLILDQIYNAYPSKYISLKALKNSSAKLIPGGSIAIVTRVGVGKIAVIETEYSTSQDFLSFVDLNINKYFMVNVLYKLVQVLKNQLQGTSIKGITKNDLLSKSIKHPREMLEQEKIGTFFKKLDHSITTHQRKLELLKELKKTLLQKLFPRNNEKMPELRFEGFTDDWEQRKLGEIVNVNSGKDYKHLERGNIPVYGTGGLLLQVNESLSNEDAIGIGRKGTINKPYLLKSPFWTVDTLFYVTIVNKFKLQFMFRIFQNINWEKYDESTGVPSLSKTTINKINIYHPLFEEQEKIGEVFKNIDNLITTHQQKLETLQTLKKTLLNQMFV